MGWPLTPRVEEEGPHGIEGSGARGPSAAIGRHRAGEGRPGAPRGSRPTWIQHRSVDTAAHRPGHRAAHRHPAPSEPCLAAAASVGLVAPAAGTPSARTRRGRDHALEDTALDAAKKNAQRRRAWLVFEDESGLSQQPVVCRTWAPRGHTPVLTHVGGAWKRLSVAAALAFRWDGRRTRFFFHTQPGAYTDRTLIAFLRQLKRHFGRQPVILIWDGLPAHKSRVMLGYLARARQWLSVERLPAYAPDLNPVEPIWGNLKRRELANLCAPDLPALRTPLRRGCARVRHHRDLAFNFLRHAGLGFTHGR